MRSLESSVISRRYFLDAILMAKLHQQSKWQSKSWRVGISNIDDSDVIKFGERYPLVNEIKQ